MSALAILSLVRRFWWAPVIAGLLIWALILRADVARKDAALERANAVMAETIARVEKATLIGKLAATDKARRIEAAQSQATQETSGEYDTKLRAAYALLAARRVRNDAQAYRGDLDGGAGGGASNPAVAAAGAGGLSVVDDDDFRVCTENTVKAIGWRTWWQRIQAIPR